MTLRGFQRRYLRKLAHPRRSVLRVGAKGVTDALLAELTQALLRDELVKVRLAPKVERDDAASRLAEASGAELCGLAGQNVILYRPNPERPRIRLPDRPAGDE